MVLPEPAVLSTVEVEIIFDTKDSGVAQRRFIDIEEAVGF